jgi:acyl-coenzyme A thioesterase PaaI-like protein
VAVESAAQPADAPEPLDHPAPTLIGPHSAICYGCGPDNPAGLHMRTWRRGDEVYSDVVFAAHHVGAPGLAHGGAVSAACDDLFGSVLYVVGEPGVTKSLSVKYRLPVRLGENHRVTARMERRDGRRLHMVASGVRPDGELCFTARATFYVVGTAHFERYGALSEHPALDALTAPRPDVRP